MTRYQAVPSRSKLSLDGRSSIHPIHTSASGLAGYFEAEVSADGQVDLSQPAKGHLEIAVDKLKTGNELEDLEMRRRLDPQRYPLVTADIKEFKAAAAAGHYHIVGDLTLHGVTRQVEGEIVVKRLDDRTISFVGEQAFDVRDFGLQPPQLFFLKVDPQVRATIEAIAERVD